LDWGLSHAGLTSESANVNAAEGFVLSRVDGRTNILDILSVSPFGEVETLRSICALLAVGIVEAKPEPIEVPEPTPETPPVPLHTASPPPRVSEPKPSYARAPEPPKAMSAEDKRAAAGQRYQEGRRLFSERKYHEAIGVLMEVGSSRRHPSVTPSTAGPSLRAQPQVEKLGHRAPRTGDASR